MDPISDGNVYMKLYHLNNELQAEKNKNETINNEYAVILKAKQKQIEQHTSTIARLNNTIKAKDALLSKSDNSNRSIHKKLDMLLERSTHY